MSIINSDTEEDYSLSEVERICSSVNTLNIDDLLDLETKEKPILEENIEDIIFNTDLGTNVLKKYNLAIESKTPINLILEREYSNDFYSLIVELKKKENIEYLVSKYKSQDNVSLVMFIMAYIIANYDDNKFLITNMNKISKLTNTTVNEVNIEDEKDKALLRYEALMKKTEDKYKKVTKFYENLEDLEYSNSPEEMANTLKLKETQINIKIKDGIYDFSIDNGAIIFDNMITNEIFPFIQYNGLNDKKFYKIYEKNLNLNDIVIADEKIKKMITEDGKGDNYIFVMMKVFHINKYELIILEFNLNEQKLTFRYPGNTLENIKNQITNLCENIKYIEEQKTFVSGTFEINFPNYDNTKFYFLTFFDEVFNKFLYVKEDANPRSLVSDRAKYYFRSYEESTITVNYSTSFWLEPLYGDKFLIDFRTRITNDITFNEFSLIMSKLVWYYNNKISKKTIAELDFVVKPYTGPDGEGLGAPLEEKEKEEIKYKSKKIDNLITKAPEIFPKSDYSRKCGCPKQPIIIDDEDVADWQNYSKDGKKHEVLVFPPPLSDQKGPRFNFVCPSENNILSFIPNPDYLSEYPILPCCTSKKKNDLYDNYDLIRKDASKFFSEKEDTRYKNQQVKTFKTLSTNQTGIIPEELNEFIQTAYPNNTFVRVGAYKNSKQSLLHCLLIASEHLENIKKESKNKDTNIIIDKLIAIRKKYMKASSIMREKIAAAFRGEIKSFVNLLSASQENYDKNEYQMALELGSEDILLDSKYYYKLLENIFHVNLFVFVYEDGNIRLEQPRHRFFHIREINLSLPTMMLFKHVSSRSFSTYEMIKSTTEIQKSEYPYLFTDVLTKYMKNYVEKSAYYVCMEKENNFDVRSNYYQNINWNILLQDYVIVGQAINDSGRMYRVNIIVEEEEISIYIPPSFPLNVPLSEKVAISDFDLASEIFEAKMTEGSQGLWFAMNGQTEAVFIPCSDVKKRDNKCVVYEIEKEKNALAEEFFQIDTIKRNANIIKQLIIWCWNLSELEEVDDWFETYVIVSDNEEENKIFSTIPIAMEYRFPPHISDTVAGIDYLANYVPLIFRNQQIYLYEDFYEAIYKYLLNYKKFTCGLEKIPNKAIINAYVNERNFKEYASNRIIVEEKNWQEWINFINVLDNMSPEIEEEDLDKIRPFIYKNVYGHIYLVQNNVSGDINMALLICKVWRDLRINLGYYTQKNTIWLQLKKDKRLINSIGMSEAQIMEKAQALSDKKIRNFMGALTFLDNNDIPYSNRDLCHYLLHHKDGTIVQTGNCKDEKYEIWHYDSGEYASLLRII